jgi:hypothetical protein
VIGSAHAKLLSAALIQLLGKPTAGDVAFLRCLPSELVDALIDAPDFVIPGWRLRAVVDKAAARRITADQAVEQREDKADPALFLIDPLRAGAGLDGIYSASREIGEAELFGASCRTGDQSVIACVRCSSTIRPATMVEGSNAFCETSLITVHSRPFRRWPAVRTCGSARSSHASQARFCRRLS